VIYLDSSVALAYLLDEGRQPSRDFWDEPLCSSRLLEYEVWTRIHARKLSERFLDNARSLLLRVTFTDLGRDRLARALEPFPVTVRTLDALHLATMDFLRAQGQELELASYDERLNSAARALGVPLYRMM
jgi:predicted nucleic acid-binding protein